MRTHPVHYSRDLDPDDVEVGARHEPCRNAGDRATARSRLALLRRQLIAELTDPTFPLFSRNPLREMDQVRAGFRPNDLHLLEYLECAHASNQD